MKSLFILLSGILLSFTSYSFGQSSPIGLNLKSADSLLNGFNLNLQAFSNPKFSVLELEKFSFKDSDPKESSSDFKNRMPIIKPDETFKYYIPTSIPKAKYEYKLRIIEPYGNSTHRQS